MRLPHPVQRFVAPQGALPKTPVEQSACVPPTQYSASWPRRELHRRPQWHRPHASPQPIQRFVAACGDLLEAPVEQS
eukprot:8110575-Pyramimonas_sp.AAC.1